MKLLSLQNKDIPNSQTVIPLTLYMLLVDTDF